MATLDGVQTTYATPGLIAPVVRATDDQGTAYPARTVVNVLDRHQLGALLQAKWTGMKGALLANDLDGALRFFLPSQQARYRTLFAALSSVLPQVARDMAPIQLITLAERRAKYRLPRTHLYAGHLVTLTYYVYFVQTAAGDWAIEGF